MQKRVVGSGKWYWTENQRKRLKSTVKIHLHHIVTQACTMSTDTDREKMLSQRTHGGSALLLSQLPLWIHTTQEINPPSFWPIFLFPEDISWLNSLICLKKANIEVNKYNETVFVSRWTFFS